MNEKGRVLRSKKMTIYFVSKNWSPNKSLRHDIIFISYHQRLFEPLFMETTIKGPNFSLNNFNYCRDKTSIILCIRTTSAVF